MIAGSVGVVQVYVLRKMASNRIQTELQVRCYVCSLSAHVVVYKVVATQYSLLADRFLTSHHHYTAQSPTPRHRGVHCIDRSKQDASRKNWGSNFSDGEL